MRGSDTDELEDTALQTVLLIPFFMRIMVLRGRCRSGLLTIRAECIGCGGYFTVGVYIGMYSRAHDHKWDRVSPLTALRVLSIVGIACTGLFLDAAVSYSALPVFCNRSLSFPRKAPWRCAPFTRIISIEPNRAPQHFQQQDARESSDLRAKSRGNTSAGGSLPSPKRSMVFCSIIRILF